MCTAKLNEIWVTLLYKYIRRTLEQDFEDDRWTETCNDTSSGGLTHGGGIADSVFGKWTLGMVNLTNICSYVEVINNVHSETAKQHGDTSVSRIYRKKNDSIKLCAWILGHPPFTYIDVIMSLREWNSEKPTAICLKNW